MFVYVWKRPDGTPFYVGMTKSINRTNPLRTGGRGWLCRAELDKIGRANVTVEFTPMESIEAAQAKERELIALYGRIQMRNGTLTNLRAGGDGSGGMSDEGKASLSAYLRKNNPAFRPDVRKKMQAALSTPEHLARMRGSENPARSDAARAKIKACWADPVWRAATIAASAAAKQRKKAV